LIWMFGGVSSVTGAISSGTSRYEGCDELGEAMLKFSNGVIGTLTASWDDVADPVRFQVAGTKGHATYGSELLLAGPDGKFQPADLLEATPSGFSAFLDHLEGKEVDLVKPREAAQRDVTMDAIYQAAASHNWVEIEPAWR
jgi:predicted dehydrogenase